MQMLRDRTLREGDSDDENNYDDDDDNNNNNDEWGSSGVSYPNSNRSRSSGKMYTFILVPMYCHQI